MKKLMMIAAMMLMSVGAFAQNEVGQITLKPMAGINISTITSADNAESKVGLIAGAEAEYGVAENIGVTFGALYSMEGCKSDDVKFLLDYINIPVLANYYVTKGLALKAGAQLGINVRHKASDGDNSLDINDFFNSIGADTKVQTINVSIPVGASYEYENFVFDARYNIGLTKIFKNTDNGRNSTFMFTIGYKFDLQ